MKPSRHSAADEQASLWAARLEGPLSSADRADLDRWLAADPAHRALLSSYCQFSADLELTLPALVEAGLVALPAATPPARRGWTLKLLAASALAAAAAVTVALWIARPRSQAAEFATASAQYQSFRLADGSQVELNAHSHLRVAFTGRERHVQLTAGEAFFSVTKDPSRPFIVETPSGSVRVTGTQFDVRTEGAPAFEVTVAEGSVRVTPGATAGGATAPVLLGAGEKLSASHGTVRVQPISATSLDATLAWRRGQIVFERAPLAAALASFARYHQRPLSVTGPAADLTIGGRFSLDDLDGFFNALETIHPVKINRTPAGAIEVTLRDQP